MQTITTETTVGEIVRAVPVRSRIFENLGIDYCCGGKKPLAEVCLAKGLDPLTVIAMLSAMDEVADGSSADADLMSLSDLCDHIEKVHHGYLREELPRLDFMTRKVAAVHGEHESRLFEIREVFERFNREMSAHIEHEDEAIFPAIRRLEASAAEESGIGVEFAELFEALEKEHESAGAALERFGALTNNYAPPEWACNTFRAMYDGLERLARDTHQHVHKENNVLFPKAAELTVAKSRE